MAIHLSLPQPLFNLLFSRSMSPTPPHLWSLSTLDTSSSFLPISLSFPFSLISFVSTRLLRLHPFSFFLSRPLIHSLLFSSLLYPFLSLHISSSSSIISYLFHFLHLFWSISFPFFRGAYSPRICSDTMVESFRAILSRLKREQSRVRESRVEERGKRIGKKIG